MKKILYTTTALIAATMVAGAAQAQTESTRYLQQNDMVPSSFKATVSGYADWYMGYADQDVTGVNEFDVMGDAQIHFNFETALRNGMTVGAHVAVETDTATEFNVAEIDQTYMYVESMYGKVIAGNHDSVNEQLSIHATDVGALDIQETDFTRFVLAGQERTAATTTYFTEDDNLTKISYMTPMFHGFQAGMTYAPSNSSEATNETVDRGSYDATIVTAAYEATVEGVGFGVSAGYAFNTDFANPVGIEGDNIDQWNVGGRVMVKGFTVAAAYKKVDNVADTSVWDAGVSYEMGPYGVSLSYISGEANKETDTTMLLSGAYNMAAGVDAFATIGFGDYESNADNKGWAVITGMMLSF